MYRVGSKLRTGGGETHHFFLAHQISFQHLSKTANSNVHGNRAPPFVKVPVVLRKSDDWVVLVVILLVDADANDRDDMSDTVGTKLNTRSLL